MRLITLTALASVVLQAAPGVEFQPLATKINQIATGKDRLRGQAESIGPEQFLTKRFVATKVLTVSGRARATFYAIPGTTKIQFLKLTCEDGSEEGIRSFLWLTGAVIGAVSANDRQEIQSAIKMVDEAAKTGKALRGFNQHSGACIKQNDSFFFLFSFE